MGDLTFSQIKSQVKANIGNRTDQDSNIAIQINIAQRRIVSRRDFKEMRQTPNAASISNTGVVDDDKVITLPSTIHKLYTAGLYDSNDTWIQPIEVIPDNKWERVILESTLQSRGKPWVGNQRGRNFYIFPLPDDDYTIRYTYSNYPTDLSGDNDTSDLEKKDDIIIDYATSRMFKLLGNTDMANFHFVAFNNALNDLIKDDYDPAEIEYRNSIYNSFGGYTYSHVYNAPFLYGKYLK